MNSSQFKGLGTALITPFTKDGAVDYERVKQLTERQIVGGVQFLVPCGTTGEAVTLTKEEYETVLGTVVDQAAGRVPILAGSGSNSTATTIDQSRIALASGANGVLVVGPYYNKPTPEGFFQHYKAVAEAVKAPIVIYNVPGRTGSNMSAETQLRIAGIEYIVGTKEASGNLSQNMAILKDRPEGFAVLSGDDNLAIAQLAIGMEGVISVASNQMPGEMSELVASALNGNMKHAMSVHYRLLPLLEGNFIESSPIPVKTAMAMMGLIEERFRLPLVEMTPGNKEKLRKIISNLGLV